MQKIVHGFFSRSTKRPKMSLRGQRFGRLVVIRFFRKKKDCSAEFLCRCDCGGKKVAHYTHLKYGTVKSCGCVLARSVARSHGECVGRNGEGSPELLAFYRVRRGCTNPKNGTWRIYGNLGIECRFQTFSEFLECLGRKPSPKHYIARKNTAGHFEKGNVFWAKDAGVSNETEYRSYSAARSRCTNQNGDAWENYGGRGIEFRFKSYEEFLAEVGRKPGPEYSLDRIDVNGHYEPGNVRWATPTEQVHNRRCMMKEVSSGLIDNAEDEIL
jgi:hypothetical protein